MEAKQRNERSEVEKRRAETRKTYETRRERTETRREESRGEKKGRGVRRREKRRAQTPSYSFSSLVYQDEAK